LQLAKEFYDLAVLKLPQDLIEHYWDCFISTNDNKGELVPEHRVLLKKWKSYIANVSVNLAVSQRRYQNSIKESSQVKDIRAQKNIDFWSALLEHPIPQNLAFIATINNLSDVETEVWRGFVQQNIRFKAEPMNPNPLQYAFEEYCKTTGQKFKQKGNMAPSDFDNTLDDTSWAQNLDDVL
jgi:hypothetical protein